jgi:hypothetical protein
MAQRFWHLWSVLQLNEVEAVVWVTTTSDGEWPSHENHSGDRPIYTTCYSVALLSSNIYQTVDLRRGNLCFIRNFFMKHQPQPNWKSVLPLFTSGYCWELGNMAIWVGRCLRTSSNTQEGIMMKQQWPGGGTQECQNWDTYNFHNTCPNGVSENLLAFMGRVDVNVLVAW